MNARTDRLVAGTVAVLLLWGALVCAGPYDFAGGTGEPNDPYQIVTAEQLASIGSDPNLLDKHFVLLNDINLDPNLPAGRTFTQAVIAPSDQLPHLTGPFFRAPSMASVTPSGISRSRKTAGVSPPCSGVWPKAR
jgi:hypothetical protein